MSLYKGVFAFCLFAATISLKAAPPAVTFESTALRITAIAPGSSVALAAIMRESGGRMYIRASEVQQVLTDDDGDGVILYEHGSAIPERSIWAVVSLTDGGAQIATPANFPRQEIPHASTFVKNTRAESFDEIAGDRFLLHVLWVRPGTNGEAWFVRTADGGANDDDGASDGKTVSSLARFRALPRSEAPPKKLKTGDVLILIDPFEMAFAAIEVAK